MNTRQFIFYRKDGSPSKPVSLATVMAAAKVRIVSGAGPYVLTQDGQNLTGGIDRASVLRRLERRLAVGKVGPQYRVRANHQSVFRCREVVPAIDIIDTNGNDKADVFWSEVVALFDSFDPRFAGAYVCKLSSQHRFGNGVDVFFNSLAQQDMVADWAVAEADRLHLQHVISRNRIWTRGVGWHAYTGDYHYHIHVDFEPNFSTGLPCGVRG